MFTKKEKTERPARPSIEYCVQVIKKTFTNDMVKEICSSEFNRITSSVDEVILIDQGSAPKVLSLDKWPFCVKTDSNCKQIYVAYANVKNGVTKIDCFVVEGIDSEVEGDLNTNNGIIRITKDK